MPTGMTLKYKFNLEPNAGKVFKESEKLVLMKLSCATTMKRYDSHAVNVMCFFVSYCK